MVIAFMVPSEKDAPRAVRKVLRAELGAAIQEHVIGDLELLVTEVITNAVKYGGRAADGDELEVRIEITDTIVTVAVTDTGAGFRPATTASRLVDEAGGFGLLLLDRLSTRWGVERTGSGFRVWFKLER